jgi:hypothetical protein
MYQRYSSYDGYPIQEKEGPEGLGRKNFKIKTQCNQKAGPRVSVLLEALNVPW